MVNSGTQFGKVIIKVARRVREGQTLPHCGGQDCGGNLNGGGGKRGGGSA